MRALLAVLILALPAPAAAEDGAYGALLEARGVALDAQGVARFLHGLAPGAQVRIAAGAAVQRLQAAGADLRDEAAQWLLAHPDVAGSLLKTSLAALDPELRRTAADLLRRIRPEIPREELYAAYQVIRLGRWKGLARPIVETLPLCLEEYLVRAGEEALRATVREADAGFLLDTAASGDRDCRVAAIRALAGLQAGPDLLPYSRDRDSRLRLAAALGLLEHGRPEALAELLDLLQDGDATVRGRAGAALRAVAGEAFDYDPFDAPDERAAAIGRWRDWAAREGEARLAPTSLPAAPLQLGRTLITAFHKEMLPADAAPQILDLDATGNESWKANEVKGSPWACCGLPDGHRMIAFYRNPSGIAEYDAAGKELWRFGDLPGAPSSVAPLRNGDLLVTCGKANVILELRAPGKIVWTRKLTGKPTDAKELTNGDLLVTLQGRNQVVELDARWRMHRILNDLKTPYSAQRLPNGNVLVCELGAERVAEYTPRGKRVWAHENVKWCYAAQRLGSGRTLIAEIQGVKLVHPSGRIEWLYRGNNYFFASRY